MARSEAIHERIAGSPVVLGATIIFALALVGAALVSRLGLPPQEALLPTGVAVFVLLMVAYDLSGRQ